MSPPYTSDLSTQKHPTKDAIYPQYLIYPSIICLDHKSMTRAVSGKYFPEKCYNFQMKLQDTFLSVKNVNYKV